MNDWKKIGKNIYAEWMEENPSGIRRISNHNGYIIEPETNKDSHIRWGRINSKDDVYLAINSLVYKNIFLSFHSLNEAYNVYSTKYKQKTISKKIDPYFKKLFEEKIACKIWECFIKNKYPDKYPDINFALNRNGLNNWPLFIDVGLYKIFKTSTFFDISITSYKNFSKIINDKIKEKSLFIKKINKKNFQEVYTKNKSNPNVFFVDKTWFIEIYNHVFDKKNFSVNDWVGDFPKIIEDIHFNNKYIPFSDPKKNGSGYVSPLLNQAQKKAISSISSTEVLDFLSSQLSLKQSMINTCLSYDQMDAIWLAYKQLIKKKSFLLADETGYGKGRVLAALSKIGLKLNYQILFFTEKKNLFSDFYRDCSAISIKNKIEEPFILHGTAKVLDANGHQVFKSKRKTINKKDKWIWTTYSQFNRNDKNKFESLKKWIKEKPTWVIMDEAQNAAGSSNTSKVIKKIQELSAGVLLSSATFAKNEEQLKAYKTLFLGNNNEWNRLLSAFVGNADILRTAITLMWAEQGVFIRREHPPISLPNPIWVKSSKENNEDIQKFSDAWLAILNTSKIWSKASYQSPSPWKRIGAALYRANREVSLLQKIPHIIKEVENCINNNQKPIVVSDWNFSSHLSRYVEDIKNDNKKQKNSEIKNHPYWKDSWIKNILDMFPDEEISQAKYNYRKEMKRYRDDIIKKLSLLPEWSLSPFDTVIDILESKKIKVGEISGRNICIKKNKENNTFSIVNKKNVNRFTIVKDFNYGNYDCLILTRAGNSGISIHSGKNFKDQRQRHLIEWDVSPDPSVRVQSWGRVRRKDQILEPEKSIILLDTAYEKKRYERDKIKQKKLYSHSGRYSDQDINNILTKNGSFIAKEWFEMHPYANNIIQAYPDYNVEKILSRVILLDKNARLSFINSLNYGIKLLNEWDDLFPNQLESTSIKIRDLWWWGKDNHTLLWEERLWGEQKIVSPEIIKKELLDKKYKKTESVIIRWSNIWNKWWKEDSGQKTSLRMMCLNWWLKHYKFFEKGMGIEINDPLLGGKTRAIILGSVEPRDSNPENWNPSQIGLCIWPISLEKPIILSLSALLSNKYAGAKIIKEKPSKSWFNGCSFPIKGMILTGPAWSISAWGTKYTDKGKLIEIIDEYGEKKWGWLMPSEYSWETINNMSRELASMSHVFAFIKDHASGSIYWRWSNSEIVKVSPQSGGFYLEGTKKSWEKMTFKQIRGFGKIIWNDDRSVWKTQISWKMAKSIFYQWYSCGSIPTVSSEYKSWHQKTFDLYCDK